MGAGTLTHRGVCSNQCSQPCHGTIFSCDILITTTSFNAYDAISAGINGVTVVKTSQLRHPTFQKLSGLGQLNYLVMKGNQTTPRPT